MGHFIDETTGEAAFVFNAQNGPAWHRLGKPVDGAMTGEEIYEQCPALDFVVDKVPVLYPGPDGPVSGPIAYKGWSVVVRTDTMAPLGIVRDTYALFQNRELTLFADAVRGESTAAYDTAGSLFEGKVVFVQLILGENFRVEGDPSDWERRLLVWAGHDGRHALVAKRTRTRVVCANTLGGAMAGAGDCYSIRHTANMDVAVEDARKALKMVAANDVSFEAAMAALALRKVNVAQVEAFIEDLFPIKEDENEKYRPYRIERYRNEFRALFDGSPTLVGVDKTAYRLYQALGEWADHYRTYRTKAGSAQDARALAIIDGPAQALKNRAMAMLLPK